MSGVDFPRGRMGPADLARAFRTGDRELAECLAGLLGYQFVPPEPPPPVEPPSVRRDAGAATEGAAQAPVELGDIPFLRAETFQVRGPLAVESRGGPPTLADAGDKKEDDKKAVDLSFMPLTSGASLLTRLRAASPSWEIRGEIDVDRIVEAWGRGRWLGTLPKRSRKVWGRSVQVFVDRARRLVPYWEDQARAFHVLRETYPPEGFAKVVLVEGDAEPATMSLGGRPVAYAPPPAGSAVVALSDLGALAPSGSRLVSLWAERGRRLRDLSVHPLAVVPCRRGDCPEELSRYWTILPWEAGTGGDAPPLDDDASNALVQQILTLLSFTLRIEPQLIRFVRRLLPAGRGNPGIESRVWQHEAFNDPHCEAAELPRDEAKDLREDLTRQGLELRREIYRWVEASRRERYAGIWFAELANLAHDNALIPPAKLDEARRWLEDQRARLVGAGTSADPPLSLLAWHREVSERVASTSNRGGLRSLLNEIWAIVHRDEPDAVPPPGADPRDLGPGVLDPPDEPEGLVELRQLGDRLLARRVPSVGPIASSARLPPPRGSLLGLIRTRNGLLKVDRPDDFWPDGTPPAWASEWGWDEFGAWVTLRVGSVTQRLRWIPPGRFLMGSPEDEEGRFEDEGPRHEEEIKKGFWLFDTPCTQGLWEEVMGANPSRFQSSTRPVEQVSWDDCQEFVVRLNDRYAGLSLGLPSETQWEYSCRAGTEVATYAGDLEILGMNNAPVLDGIAWYGGNCGVDFELLSEGYDISDFSEKQYEHKFGGTHPVGLKAPNAWGFYDMLGNVFEWCQDVWTDSYKQSEKSKYQSPASAPRVFRGGSWYYEARVVRAAFRDLFAPSYRYDRLGFRCAEFRSPGPAGENQEAERAVSGSKRVAEPREDREQASGAGWLRLAVQSEDSVSLPVIAPTRIASDVDELTFRATKRPRWASAIGRDKFGLWADFTVEAKDAASGKVRQRLRWIPPGRFLMGSPEEEVGRDEDEGPRHEVTFESGFWMFATSCTQALWEAIMGANPSRFRSPTRPVENVSWDDCQEFVVRLNDRYAGLSLGLPSERQWEYSCRAGTEVATYAGDVEILGMNNAPVLDGIAWYGGNCGVDFELLSEGYDISDWREKQYEHRVGGTHPVGLKAPNVWGLYDMLGNVWEWCDTVWTDNYSKKFELEHQQSTSAHRVIRGGSWIVGARSVRAAYRLHDVPSDRNDDLGFRCAEFREGIVSRQEVGER